jgi:hypothetical protein
VKGGRRTLLAALAALHVVACHIILGLGDERFRVDTSDGAAEGGSTCAFSLVPPPPPADTPSGDPSRTFFLAMEKTNVSGRSDAGTIAGYDLDGVCTCDPRDRSIRAGKPSCLGHPEPVVPGTCDADGGVDNAVADVFTFFEGLASVGPSFFDGTGLVCGDLNVLITITDYNGQANDSQIFVTLLPSFGIREPHDGGESDASIGCRNDGAAPFPPKFDGTDRWSVRKGDLNSAGVPPQLFRAYVKDFQLVLDGRGKTSEFPLILGSTTVNVGTAVVTGRLVPLDERGAELPVVNGAIQSNDGTAASFRLRDAILSGRTSVDDVLGRVGRVRVAKGVDPYFCSGRNKPIYDLFKDTICRAVDTVAEPTRDFTDAPCDAVSIVLLFEAGPVQLGTEYDPPPSPGCAANFEDKCPPR